MFKICLSFVAIAVLTLFTQANAQVEENQDSDVPLYLDDNGEEIFGPGYYPEMPKIKGSELLIGSPNAGIKIPDEYKAQPHLLFAPRIGLFSDPKSDELSLLRDPRLPYLDIYNGPEDDEIIEPQPDPDRSLGNREFKLKQMDPAVRADPMYVHFINVGQGDAAIVQFPCGIAVIDTGGEFGHEKTVHGAKMFLDYLTEFFDENPKYNDTVDVLFTTHPHADHLNGLPLLVDKNDKLKVKILNVVDNGQTKNKGSMGKQTKFRRIVVAEGGDYTPVALARQVIATGATNDDVDPFKCSDIDPIITVFWGGIDKEATSAKFWDTPNDHSLVIRIDYGDASFLFTGDLEARGEKALRKQYRRNLGVFDVDVYQVSHHGAGNDTSDTWVKIMSPKIGVLSMGDPSIEKTHTAWDHGHPRTKLISILQNKPHIVSNKRSVPEKFLVANSQETKFQNVEIHQAIFGTAWEGTVIIEATSDGDYTVMTER